METTSLPAMREVRAAMARTNELFNSEVFGRKNFDALDEIYTKDARILPPGTEMIAGRENIRKFWSDLVQSAHAQSAVLSTVDVIAAGDGVVEIGRATLTVLPPGQPEAQMTVKYVVLWRPEDRLWKWHVDIWNNNG